jgi:hypothetical protein
MSPIDAGVFLIGPYLDPNRGARNRCTHTQERHYPFDFFQKITTPITTATPIPPPM